MNPIKHASLRRQTTMQNSLLQSAASVRAPRQQRNPRTRVLSGRWPAHWPSSAKDGGMPASRASWPSCRPKQACSEKACQKKDRSACHDDRACMLNTACRSYSTTGNSTYTVYSKQAASQTWSSMICLQIMSERNGDGRELQVTATKQHHDKRKQ